MNLKISRTLYSFVGAVLMLLLGGCAVSLVQPYDEKLLTDTEVLFKKTSAMIDEGIEKSPEKDEDRLAIVEPENHPAHFSKFAERYRTLETDADALILRALSKSQEVSPIGEKLQNQIIDLVEKAVPTKCKDIENDLRISTSSLTVKNYIDLKCIVVNWKGQHSDAKLTKETLILKRTNWELRKSAIFSAILAIQKAETSKKSKDTK